MEEYKFDLVIKGHIRAYSPEHAEDSIKELTDALFNADGVYSSQEILKIGDKISPLQTNIYITSETRELLKSCFDALVKDIFEDIEEFTTKPSIFDRTNYNDVRNSILKKMEKYKSERFGTTSGERYIDAMVNSISNEIYTSVVAQISRDIIGGIEEVKQNE
jgi:hypothetical protein